MWPTAGGPQLMQCGPGKLWVPLAASQERIPLLVPREAPQARWAPGSLVSPVPWPVAMHVGVSLLGFCPMAQSQGSPRGVYIDIL